MVAIVLREGDDLRLLCANCGDSRAVLCRKGHAVELSRDHKPSDLDTERQRIEAAGGRLDMSGRIDGGLNLSRALGDFEYKSRSDLAADQQKVIAQPEIQSVVVVPGEDEFLVLGSDGVFDVFSSGELVARLRAALQAASSEKVLKEAVRKVLQDASGSGDNATLCVVRFLSRGQCGG